MQAKALPNVLAFLGFLTCASLLHAQVTTTPLHDAILARDLSLVRSLIADPTTLERSNGLGQTPLVLASWVGDAPIVSTLLEAGASVTSRDDSGATALMMAMPKRVTSAVMISLSVAGAPLDAQDQFGRSALMIAAQQGDVSRLRFLLTLGANPKLRDKLHRTAYEYALESEDVASIKLLSLFPVSSEALSLADLLIARSVDRKPIPLSAGNVEGLRNRFAAELGFSIGRWGSTLEDGNGFEPEGLARDIFFTASALGVVLTPPPQGLDKNLLKLPPAAEPAKCAR